MENILTELDSVNPIKPELNSIWGIVSLVFNFFIRLLGIVLVFVFIWSGFQLLTAQGNPEKVSSAQKAITNSIIGLILLASAFIIVKVVAYIFKLPFGNF